MITLDVLGLGQLELPGDNLGEALELGGRRTVEHCKKWKDLSNNCEAMRTLMEVRMRRVGPPEVVVDGCAGVGLWATVALSFHLRKLVLYEMDDSCAAHLRRSFPTAIVRRADGWGRADEGADLTLLDLTKCTMLSVDKVGARLRGEGDVILSDCAGIKLHLNYASYGLRKGASYRDYLRRYNRTLRETYGRNIAAAVYCGNSNLPPSGYLLLTRTEEGDDFPLVGVDRPEGITVVIPETEEVGSEGENGTPS